MSDLYFTLPKSVSEIRVLVSPSIGLGQLVLQTERKF